MSDEYKFEINGYDVHNGRAAKSGTGAHMFVPKSWRDKKVVAILLEPLK